MQSISQTKAATMWGHVWGAPTVYMELLDSAKGYLGETRRQQANFTGQCGKNKTQVNPSLDLFGSHILVAILSLFILLATDFVQFSYSNL